MEDNIQSDLRRYGIVLISNVTCAKINAERIEGYEQFRYPIEQGKANPRRQT